ncbi:MAG: 30S ribosomal protein S8 [Gemmatimonadetes bacterium]|nr:30S ribosomal protein S8 [Gemmatimonadota bacterium]
MSMTDPIADMLTRIRNASRAKHNRVDIPKSKVKLEIAKALAREKFVSRYKVIDSDLQGTIRVYLKYGNDGVAIISGVKRISKPGLRKYVGTGEIPRVYGGIGTAILSTSRGVLTDKEARTQHIGGEILCYIW